MQVGSSADAATCAQTTRSSFRPSKDKRQRHEIRSVVNRQQQQQQHWCLQELIPVFQVKKLQVMLRQANEQLERTMTDKQNLEDSVQSANKETTAKVSILLFDHISCSSFHSRVTFRVDSLPITISDMLKNCNIFHLLLLELNQILDRASLPLPSGGFDPARGNFQRHKMQIFQFFNWSVSVEHTCRQEVCCLFPLACFFSWIGLYLAKIHNYNKSNNLTAAVTEVFPVFMPPGVHPPGASPGF